MTDEPLSLPSGFDRELTQLIDAIETLRDALSEEETLTTVQAVTTRRRLFLALYALKAIRRQLADTEHPPSQGDHKVVTWDDSAQALYHIELRLDRLLEDLSIQGYDHSSQEYSIEQTLDTIRDHIVILQDALSGGRRTTPRCLSNSPVTDLSMQTCLGVGLAMGDGLSINSSAR